MIFVMWCASGVVLLYVGTYSQAGLGWPQQQLQMARVSSHPPGSQLPSFHLYAYLSSCGGRLWRLHRVPGFGSVTGQIWRRTLFSAQQWRDTVKQRICGCVQLLGELVFHVPAALHRDVEGAVSTRRDEKCWCSMIGTAEPGTDLQRGCCVLFRVRLAGVLQGCCIASLPGVNQTSGFKARQGSARIDRCVQSSHPKCNPCQGLFCQG
jgi:hypothetical protein